MKRGNGNPWWTSAVLVAGLAGLLAAPASAESSAPRQRVLRSWQENVKQDGREVARRVEVVFDYRRGVALERVYGADQELLFERPTAAPAPSDEEIAEAEAMVRADAELDGLARAKALFLSGGFVLWEEAGRPCGPGSRCLQIFAFPDPPDAPLFRAVVDLVRREIVYRDLGPLGAGR